MRQEDFIMSLPQVCKRYNKTEVQVRYAIKQGRLKAHKAGWQWYFHSKDLPAEWPEPPRTVKRLKRGKTVE